MRQQIFEDALKRIHAAAGASLARMVEEAQVADKAAAERAFADMSLTLQDIEKIAEEALRRD